MHARKALLKSLATVNAWDEADLDAYPRAFDGLTCVETRNTIYRFRDGVCFGVTNRNQTRSGRGSALVGMRIVGWLVTGELHAPKQRLTRTWQPGACAVLFRPCASGGDDGAMALTSPTIDFTNGLESTRLQAFHDAAPPSTSSLYRREAPPLPAAAPGVRSPFTYTRASAELEPPRRSRLKSQSGG
jgi:hypothetical protein